MKRYLITSSLLLLSAQPYANTTETNIQPISESEAAAIVAAEETAKETAKEAAKDAKEAELNSADISKTVTLKQGDKTIVFNLVKPSKISRLTNDIDAKEKETVVPSGRGFFVEPDKQLENLTLSGSVDEDGISELWWNYNNQRHRIFTNADFRLLSGIGDFSDETHRYSVFSLVTAGGRGLAGRWYPKPSDFTEGQLEYFVVEGGDDAAAYAGIECMMRHLAENEDVLITKRENKEKLDAARAAFLKANPPKKRDIILNYSEQ